MTREGMDIMDIEQLYWQFDAAHHGTGEYTGMARSERDAFKLVVARALAEKDREIEYLRISIQDLSDALLSALQREKWESNKYHALMREAVQFAQNIIYIMGALCENRSKLEMNGHVIKSRAFLASPKVQAWREKEG